MYKHLAVTATSTIPPMIAIMSRKLKPESSHFAIMEDALVPEERPPEQRQSIQQLLITRAFVEVRPHTHQAIVTPH